MSYRGELENKYTVICRRCGRKSIDANRHPAQKYAKDCPYGCMKPEVCPKCLKRNTHQHDPKNPTLHECYDCGKEYSVKQ